MGSLLDSKLFYNFTKVSIGDGKLLSVKHIGKSTLHNNPRPVVLSPIYHVPNLAWNLISVHQLCHDNDCFIGFDGLSFCVKNKKARKVLLWATSSWGLYLIPNLPLPSWSFTLVASTALLLPWHAHLGHFNSQIVHYLGKSILDHKSCSSWDKGKTHRLLSEFTNHHGNYPLALIHPNVWTSPICSNLDFKYSIIFVDDFSRLAISNEAKT